MKLSNAQFWDLYFMRVVGTSTISHRPRTAKSLQRKGLVEEIQPGVYRITRKGHQCP